MPKKETEPCTDCGATGKIPGARYTDPERDCPTCKGTGKVAKAE